MMKKFILLFCALFLLWGIEAPAASDAKSKKNTSKSARQKNRRSKKAKEQKAQRENLKLRRDFQEIHKLQEKLLEEKGDAGAVKKYTAKINEIMKKLAPQMKTLGKVPGIKNMTNVEALIKEGQKLFEDPKGISDLTVLEKLHSTQLEAIDKLRDRQK